jgi:hypothetical protein
MVDD